MKGDVGGDVVMLALLQLLLETLAAPGQLLDLFLQTLLLLALVLILVEGRRQ